MTIGNISVNYKIKSSPDGPMGSLAPVGLRSSGFSCFYDMDRATFIIDGFNLYHSVRIAQYDMGGTSTKWLDIRSLLSSYLHLLGKNAVLDKIYYFSALAKHLEASKPDVTKRHRDYIRCLQATGIITELHRFKKKTVWCTSCNNELIKFEEKETDVAIAVKLLELLFKDACDTVVLVTGDTDIAPAVKTANIIFPYKRIVFAFPYKRKNKELSQLAPGSFEIKKEQYAKHQFPDPYTIPNGCTIIKPSQW